MGVRKIRVPTKPPVAPSSARLRAKVFWTGRSQAVRLPREFRFEGSQVRVRRVDVIAAAALARHLLYLGLGVRQQQP